MSDPSPTQGPPVVSVHIADVGAKNMARTLFQRPKPGSIAGLRSAETAVTAMLGQSFPPKLDVKRAALIAFWDDDESLSRFHDTHPLAQRLAGGFHARLEPLRAHGSWPGLGDAVPRARRTSADGRLVVLTLARTKASRLIDFLRTSAKAEKDLLKADGVEWATALSRPPFVGTVSIWESEAALTAYAYAVAEAGHPQAIARGRQKPFHKQEAFIRFRPYRLEGGLSGRNPLPEQRLAH